MGCSTSHERMNFHENYVLGGKVWQDDRTQVRIVRKINKAEELSVKIVDLRKDRFKDGVEAVDPLLRKRGQEEAMTWLKVGDHENVVKLLEVMWDAPLLFMVTELCDYSLLYVLERMPLVNEQTLSRIFKDATKGLEHVHRQGVVHCGVRPDSFMVCGKTFTLKLTGFQFAASLPNEGALLYKEAGTVPFMSPEMVSKKGYSFKTDMWSLGVMMYVFFYGQFPYQPKERTAESMKEAIRVGVPAVPYEPWMEPSRPNEFSKAASDFLRALLNRDVKERPTAAKALEHPYLQQADLDEIQEEALKQKLLPMLCGALRCGAFGKVTASELEDTEIDLLLSYQQFPYHGPIKPWTEPRPYTSILQAAAAVASNQEEAEEVKALQRSRHGETAQQLRRIQGSNGATGEFSISLSELKKMRDCETYGELRKIMPARPSETDSTSPRTTLRTGTGGGEMSSSMDTFRPNIQDVACV